MLHLVTAQRFYIIASLITIIGWGWLLFSGSIVTDHTVCLFKNITSYPCPSCGTTTSMIAVANGHWLHAANSNILGFPALLILLALPIALTLDTIGKKRYTYTTYVKLETTFRKKPYLLYIFLILITINWIWNLYHLP